MTTEQDTVRLHKGHKAARIVQTENSLHEYVRGSFAMSAFGLRASLCCSRFRIWLQRGKGRREACRWLTSSASMSLSAQSRSDQRPLARKAIKDVRRIHKIRRMIKYTP